MRVEKSSGSSYTDNLRERLRLHGITHGALSRQSGFTPGQISRWMNTSVEPNWRTIVRIEAAVAAIAPSAALNVLSGSTSLDRSDASELIRLREYIAEFRHLIDLYDRTPPRWKYFQTEWLWMYARGMIEGAAAAEVKTRRLTELHTKGESGDEEAAALRETSVDSPAHFMKGELYGGPGDGGYVHLRVPVSDRIVVDVPSMNGELVGAGYRRAPGTLGDIIQARLGELDDIENAFEGKKTAKYIYDPEAEF